MAGEGCRKDESGFKRLLIGGLYAVMISKQ